MHVVGLAAQGGEGGPGIREGVDPDAEPRHAVRAAHPEQGEEHDDADSGPAEADQGLVVDDDDGGDEGPQEDEEAALPAQIRLAGGVDELGDLQHRRVHGGLTQAQEGDRAEPEAEQAHDDAGQEQGPAVQAPGDGHARQVGEYEVGLSAAVIGGGKSGCEGGKAAR